MNDDEKTMEWQSNFNEIKIGQVCLLFDDENVILGYYNGNMNFIDMDGKSVNPTRWISNLDKFKSKLNQINDLNNLKEFFKNE